MGIPKTIQGRENSISNTITTIMGIPKTIQRRENSISNGSMRTSPIPGRSKYITT
jgi:hypothetical protein